LLVLLEKFSNSDRVSLLFDKYDNTDNVDQ